MSEVGLTKVTGKDELLALAHRIEPDLPFCASMYNNLLIHGRGHSSRVTFYALSNKPDSHAVMWLAKEKRTHAAFFCREEEVGHLMRALKDTPLLDWSEFLEFHNVPDYLVGPLQELAEERGGNSLSTWPRFNFTYQPHLDQDPLRCAAGFRVCRLGRAGLLLLLATSKFIKNDPPEPMWRFIQKVPAAGVYPDPSLTESTRVDLGDLPPAGDEELPVSWMTTTKLGSLGRLGTAEDYRRQGLASLIMRVGARLQLSQGYIPHARVELNNSAALAMFREMPEWSQTHTSARMAPTSSDFP